MKPASHLEDPRWTSVRTRDRAAGGFFYSVRTTGVYCRPACAARTPNPKNVAFHASAAAAEAAGFRPCLRCRPDAPPLADRQTALIAQACRSIEAAQATPTLDVLSRQAGLSPHHFHRLFKAVVGLTPRAYAASLRGAQVRHELTRSATVTQAIHDAGYGSAGRFYEESDALLGMSPGAFRAGGEGAEMRVAVTQSSLGAVLVAASDRGICAILIGDDPDSLLCDLKNRFPKARIAAGDEDFDQMVAAVVAFVEAPRLGLELPLDIRGTAFQRRVWQALRAIPPGATASYREIAQAIGAPKSVRAVAGACAANPLAVAVPCHRVLRSNGGLSGYRWGVERKRALLSRETRPGATYSTKGRS